MVSQVYLVPVEALCTAIYHTVSWTQAVLFYLSPLNRVLPQPGALLILQGPAQLVPLMGASPGRSTSHLVRLPQSWVSILQLESPVAPGDMQSGRRRQVLDSDIPGTRFSLSYMLLGPWASPSVAGRWPPALLTVCVGLWQGALCIE